MSIKIERLLFELLKNVCNGKVYPLIAEEAVSVPYVVYTPISDVKKDVFCGIAESRVTVQIDAYHKTYDEMLLLKENILSLLNQLPFFNIYCSQSYEKETKIHRAMIEASINQ